MSEDKPKFKRVIEIPKKESETEQAETETPILTEVVKECPECHETEEWYYDEKNDCYYCGKCRKIFLKD